MGLPHQISGLKQYKLSNPLMTIKYLEESYKSQSPNNNWTLVYVVGVNRDRLLVFKTSAISYQQIKLFPIIQRWARLIWEMIKTNYYDEEQEKIANDKQISINNPRIDQLVLPLAVREQLILASNSIHSLTDTNNRLIFSSPKKAKSFYQQMIKVIIDLGEDLFHDSSNLYPNDWLEIDLDNF